MSEASWRLFFFSLVEEREGGAQAKRPAWAFEMGARKGKDGERGRESQQVDEGRYRGEGCEVARA